MDTLLIKIFAAALTFSHVATAPDALRTHFDPDSDRQQVTDLLRGGCAQVRKAFDVESINLDDLIATAMEDPEAVAGERAEFRGLDLHDLQTAYRQFCKNETLASSPIDLGGACQLAASPLRAALLHECPLRLARVLRTAEGRADLLLPPVRILEREMDELSHSAPGLANRERRVGRDCVRGLERSRHETLARDDAAEPSPR